MILEKESEIRITRVLSNEWYKSFDYKELSEKSGLSKSHIFPVVRRLLIKDIIKKENQLISLNFKNRFVFVFKKLFDMEFIYSLDRNLREKIFYAYDWLKNKLMNDIIALLLIGSITNKSYKRGSDIDMVVIVKKESDIDLTKFERLHITMLKDDEFEKRFNKKEDFILGSLMSGKIIVDNEFITRFYQYPILEPDKEQIYQKQEMVKSALDEIANEIRGNMIEKAKNKLKACVDQLIRIELINKGEVTKSKSENLIEIRKLDPSPYKLFGDAEKIKGKEDAADVLVRVRGRL